MIDSEELLFAMHCGLPNTEQYVDALTYRTLQYFQETAFYCRICNVVSLTHRGIPYCFSQCLQNNNNNNEIK